MIAICTNDDVCCEGLAGGELDGRFRGVNIGNSCSELDDSPGRDCESIYLLKKIRVLRNREIVDISIKSVMAAESENSHASAKSPPPRLS